MTGAGGSGDVLVVAEVGVGLGVALAVGDDRRRRGRGRRGAAQTAFVCGAARPADFRIGSTTLATALRSVSASPACSASALDEGVDDVGLELGELLVGARPRRGCRR